VNAINHHLPDTSFLVSFRALEITDYRNRFVLLIQVRERVFAFALERVVVTIMRETFGRAPGQDLRDVSLGELTLHFFS